MVTRQAQWQKERIKKGRCRQCGRKRSKKSKALCPRCLKKDRERKQ